MKSKFLLLAFCFFAAALCAEEAAPPAAEKSAFEILSDQARVATPERYAFAVEHKAQILPMPDGRSFYLFSQPAPGAPIIVTLHGHASWAYDEYYLWHEAATKHGYGILAVQWWFGKGEEISDYYTAEALYPMLETIFHDLGIAPGRVVFHGFSRGSAMSYSGKDEHPARDGCEGMNNTRQWLERFNGKVDLFIQDPDAPHGGFHRNPKNIDAALDVCDRLLKPKPAAGKP